MKLNHIPLAAPFALSAGAVTAASYTLTDLGALPGGSDSSQATGINDSGQVVGVDFAATGARAVLWDSGTLTDLGDLPGGGDMSRATGINDSGQVVGVSSATGGDRAFLWDSTTGMQNLNDLIDPTIGWVLQDARGINASGQIVGFGNNGSATRGFLLTPASATTPIPLPAGLPLLAAALGGLAWLRRRGLDPGRSRRTAGATDSPSGAIPWAVTLMTRAKTSNPTASALGRVGWGPGLHDVVLIAAQ
jgi:probable HAF family extracellular repeat protein